MGFRFNVPLPGPFSYSPGGGGPTAEQRHEARRAHRTLQDMYCREHLIMQKGIDWFLYVVGGLLSLAVFGLAVTVPVGVALAALTVWGHRARDKRRAADPALGDPAGCGWCQDPRLGPPRRRQG